jgi:hypothetical protein
MKKVLASALVIPFVVGCTSDVDKAKSLGFSNPEQMKYLNSKGFKNFDEFSSSHPFVIKSSDTKFANSELGFKAKLIGEEKPSDSGNYYDGGKGVWMSANEAGDVNMIGYSCIIDKNPVEAIIDGIGCNSSLEQFELIKKSSKEYCSYNSHETTRVFFYC